MPANCRVAAAVKRYSSRIKSTVTVAARPGTFWLPTDSSLTVRQTSQPQKMKIDSDSPAAKAEKDSTLKGLNHSGWKTTGAASGAALKAAREKPISTSSCMATRPYWTLMVMPMPMPRQLIQTAMAMNTQQVTMFTSRCCDSAANSARPLSWARNR